MKHHVFLPFLCAAAVSAHAQTTSFTYQGFLTDVGAPANGVYDLTFTLFNAASGGSAVGASNVVDDLAVTNGLFTVALTNFGSAPFDGSDLWLQIALRPGASAGACDNILQVDTYPLTIYSAAAIQELNRKV